MKKRLMMFLAGLFLSLGTVLAQTQVSGKVTSAEDGSPLIGATVKVQGTNTGAITDIDGNFSLSAPADAKLEVSYVGMATQVVKAGKKLNIVLKSDGKDLDEVMVVAYGTQKKSTFTGSATTVKSETIEKKQVSNLTQALAGNVVGVQATSANGQPGTSATIRVRGFGSINAGMSPLYVVDGIAYDGDISAINTQDIESMTVLKDAAAAALYGARGANGVILINTKKGKKGQDARITVEGRWGSNSREVKNYNVIGSTNTYMEKLYEAQYNNAVYNLGYNTSDAYTYANEKAASAIGYPLYTVSQGNLFTQDGKISPNATLGYSDGQYYYTPDDWSNEMFSNGLRQEYNIGINGGSDKLTYYLSAGYLQDEGVIEHSGFNRLSTRLNVDYQAKKWLKIGANLAYTNSKSKYPGEQTSSYSNSSANAFFLANNIAPVYPIYSRNADGSIRMDGSNPIYDYGDKTAGNYTRNFMSMANPLGDLTYKTQEYLMDIMNSKWYVVVTPVEGLTITANLGLSVDNTRYHYASSTKYGQSASYGGEAVQEHSRTYGFTQQYIANYKNRFFGHHNIDVTAGFESYEYQQEVTEAYGQNLYKEGDWAVNNTIDQRRGYGSVGKYATNGFISRINYDYDEKYFVSLSYRRDGSSRFSKDNRWGNFWSASAAWEISKENWFTAKWVDFLKLKASFGQQGNDNIGNYYAYLDQYTMTGSDGVFSDGTLAYKGNPDLTWETTNAFNVGVDFSLWGGKLAGTVEYFSRQTEDMLYNKPVATSNGYSSIPMNVGSMRNSGLEIDLRSDLIKTKDITWSLNANATLPKNKIIKLHEDLGGEWISGSRIYREGESMYQYYLVKYAGVDKSNGMALYWAKDGEGNEYTTTDWSTAYKTNRQGTGDLLPSIYGGFGTSLTAYGFDFSIQFAYQMGGKIYDSGYQNLMHAGGSSDAGQNWHTDILNSWTPTNTNTNIPRVCADDNYTASTSNRWLINSNYLSIGNITLGYTIPQNLTRSIGIESLRLYGAADNVAIFSARKGLDPRQSFTSATTSLYTALRTISFGLKVSF